MATITYKSYSNATKKILLDAMRTGAKEAAEQVLDAADKLVPLDEGPLQSSGVVTVDKDTVYVSYGIGESADYAIIQHENLDYAHAPGRQAKYLETPFRAQRDQIINTIKKAIAAVSS